MTIHHFDFSSKINVYRMLFEMNYVGLRGTDKSKRELSLYTFLRAS